MQCILCASVVDDVDELRWMVIDGLWSKMSPDLILIFSCTDPTWKAECEYFDHDQQV